MKHPNRAPFESAFKAIRPFVIERDGGRCVKCASDVRIEVHHVNGYEDNAPDNLQTLCYFCHGVAPMGDEYWIWKQSGADGWNHFFAAMRLSFPNLTEEYMRSTAAEIVKYQKIMESGSARAARAIIRQRSGRCEGPKPYGHRPHEMSCLLKMRELRASGMTYESVAMALNDGGFVTRYGKQWSRAAIYQILQRNRDAATRPPQ